MPPAKDSADPSTKSPFAGCAIFIVVILVMLFLIGFSTFVVFRQAGEIEKFTATAPAPLEVEPLEDREADLNALAERLEAFRSDLVSGKETTIALGVEDLNLAIAAYEPLKDLRGTFRVISIEPQALRVAISFRMNGRPRLTRDGEQGMVTSDPRFLNAVLIAKPALEQKEIALRLDDVMVEGATVPREFIEQMSPYRISERYKDYKEYPVIGPAMAKLTGAEIIDGKLILRRKNGEEPPQTISKHAVDSAGGRLFAVFAIAATAFLLFVALVLFLGLRRKRKSA